MINLRIAMFENSAKIQLKQLFFSISVNNGFYNIYLAASRLVKYSAIIHLYFKE